MKNSGKEDQMDDILQVRNLVKRFESGGGWLGGQKQVVRAVNDVSFSVHRGQSLGLVGESGCGKSTVARTLLRLIEPDEGSIVFDGQDIRRAGGQAMRALRRRVQIVFQDPYASLNPRRTVRQALTEPLHVHRMGTPDEIARKVEQAIDEVGLPASTLDRYPHEFSGGQRQRIGIARALVLDPELIVADEPVSALDVSVQAQILQLLDRLKRDRGLSFVFVSHDLGVVRHFCDSVCVMYLGRIIEQGPTAQVLDTPRHPYSRVLRDSSPVPDPQARIRLMKIEGEIPSPTHLPPGCAFHPRCARAQADCKSAVPPLAGQGDRRLAACFHPLV
ncbi:ATP-binding cassette domain-containing protein [Bordetella holmesii]|uniref:Glutathione import ATP-binding protein GsiA n=2 Tax=Bordetella holmesii TaxID=35814 RepID=A0A158M536_9BORD|nr:peptide ABC transporter ATP-binding protein [Bordetella holmesii H558]AOB36830.1 peptide ABC transporter ATP-binding protein [Bordetella holmesii]KAK83674.1 oligopeptide/dipeptide transporter, C-terminal domain protein [Bordetella holmesii CDC-H809-BH]KAK86404.1 oligopeptide/dipeptide transporter, C-terminal domain protein [Bordetella holmesii CDC-H572-BH]KAK87478.1 oligopeptide/dipeptide transporter, C-terminal domain protein [Bordetella holmesii H620]KAK91072.1 oligopeptide/dipeptide tran